MTDTLARKVCSSGYTGVNPKVLGPGLDLREQHLILHPNDPFTEAFTVAIKTEGSAVHPPV